MNLHGRLKRLEEQRQERDAARVPSPLSYSDEELHALNDGTASPELERRWAESVAAHPEDILWPSCLANMTDEEL